MPVNSYCIFKTVQKATAVTHSISCHFTADTDDNLVLAKGNVLEVYKLVPAENNDGSSKIRVKNSIFCTSTVNIIRQRMLFFLFFFLFSLDCFWWSSTPSVASFKELCKFINFCGFCLFFSKFFLKQKKVFQKVFQKLLHKSEQRIAQK